jgi:CHAT domain-containing protein
MTVAAESARNHNMPPLRHAVPETRCVVDVATKAGASRVFEAGAASEADLLAALRSSHIVHFACHGIQHREEPHKSHFCLSTCDLSVSELMNLELKDAVFAYLSACETAKGDSKHADEVVHLAATMLFAGFKSVVATMW